MLKNNVTDIIETLARQAKDRTMKWKSFPPIDTKLFKKIIFELSFLYFVD